MTTDTQTAARSNPPGAPPIKRKLRNYLLDPKFQLKYTGMVVVVTLAVASVLGWFAYTYSRGQHELFTQSRIVNEVDPMLQRMFMEESEKDLRNVGLWIIAGVALLSITLGVTGIIVTHKLVGPAYKLRKLINDVADGHLRLSGRLRRGDELQEVFLAFERLVNRMREKQDEEVRTLTAAIEDAEKAGTPPQVVARLSSVRDRMKAELD